MGQRRSSYVYTMGFGVSAPTVDFTTRKAVAYSHSFPNKIILNCHPFQARNAWSKSFKLSSLERGTSEIRGLQISKNNEDALFGLQAVLRHDRFIIGHDNKGLAERRLLW